MGINDIQGIIKRIRDLMRKDKGMNTEQSCFGLSSQEPPCHRATRELYQNTYLDR